MTEITTNAEGTTYAEENTTLVENTPEETITDLRTQVANLTATRERLARTIENLRSEVQERDQHLEGLGEALRAEAIRLELCDDYDTFAEEWNLPRRFLDFEVTMTLTVIAGDEESALEFVRDNVSITNYSENVKSGPEFEASEA